MVNSSPSSLPIKGKKNYLLADWASWAAIPRFDPQCSCDGTYILVRKKHNSVTSLN